MSVENRKRKARHIRHLLDTEGDSVHENTQVFNEGRYESTADLDDYEALKDEAREIKEDAIERLPELIDEVTESDRGQRRHRFISPTTPPTRTDTSRMSSTAGTW